MEPVWGTKSVTLNQLRDLALNSAADPVDADTTKLVAVVNILAFDATPTWDLAATATSGDAFNLDLSTTDRVWVDSGDGKTPINATCTVDVGNSDRCTWSDPHIWAAPLDTAGDNTHRITAKVISDNGTPSNDNDDFFLTNATSGQVQDDTPPDSVTVQPHTLTAVKSTIDLGTDDDNDDTTFPYSNLLNGSWALTDPNAVPLTP